MFRGEHNKSLRKCTKAILLIIREQGMSRNNNGIQIGDTSSRSQNAVSQVESNYLSHLLQDEILHEDKHWSYLIREHVCVCCGCYKFPGQGHCVKSTGKLVKEIRMTWN